jgi:glycosyltransferase involved in cell wall biosynthesis
VAYRGAAGERRAPVILYTLGSLKVGGAEIRSLQLFAALKRDRPGLALVLYVTCREGGPLAADFAALGVPIVEGPRGAAGLAHLWWTCARLRVAILHCNADTVSGFYCMAAALAGARRRIAHYRVTAPPGYGLYQRLLLHLGRVLLRLFATDVIGVCAAARALAGVAEERWSTLYNGIVCPDRAPAAPPPAVPPRLLYLARIHPEKGYERALAVFVRLAARASPAAELHFVGTGAPREVERLRTLIASSPAREAIFVHGLSRRPQQHLERATVLLLPSLREGLPGAVLEALCHGVPAVASDLPGLREIRAHSAGLTLVPADAPADRWADAIEAALADGSREAGRAAIRAAFARSPFLFDAHLDAVERLWALPPAAPR